MKFLRSIAVGLAAGMLLFGLACGESPTGPDPDPLPVPTTLEAAGGDAQNGTVGTALAMLLTARVLDANGRAMADVAVTWSVVTGGGTVTAANARTSSDGTITATWTLGPTIGAQSVRATAGTLARSFTATAAADRPATITPTPDSLLFDAVGDSVAPTYSVKDRFGNAIAAPALQFALGSAADSAVAAVGGSGMVKAKTAGRILLRVQADTATLQLPVRVAPVVTALGLPAAPACLAAVGDTVRLTASPADRNGNVVAEATRAWTSRSATVAVVDTAGVVTAKANGSAWIVATATTARGAKSDSVQVCVAQAVARVAVTPERDTLQSIERSVSLTAAAYDANDVAVVGATFAWESKTTATATVDTAAGATVNATAHAEGTALVVVTSGAVADTATIVVHLYVASLAVTAPADTITVGATQALTVTASDSTGTAIAGRATTWTSRDTTVVSVNASGQVTGRAVGTAWIQAAVDAARDSVRLAIIPVPVATVVISPDSVDALVADTVRLAAAARSASGDTLAGRAITWATSDPALATVDANGLVTMTAAGRATITATSEGKSDTAVVRIAARAVGSVALSADSITVMAGGTAALAATVRDDRGQVLVDRAVAWTSGNTAVATVDAAGMVTAVSAGGTWIHAASGGQLDSAHVTVTPVPVAQVMIGADSLVLAIGDTGAFTATTLDAGGAPLGGRVITWTTADAGIASVDAAGAVVAVGSGRTTITATSEGKSDTAVVIATVRAVGAVELPSDSLTLVDGDSTRLVATVRDDLGNVLTDRTVTWTSSDAAVAAVDADGLVTAHSAGTTWVHAATGGHRDSTHVTVTPGAVADVNVVPDSLNALVGDTVVIRAVTLDATGDTLTGRAITWSVSDTTLAWADTGGVIATRAAGRLEVTVTSEGKSDTAVVVIAPRPITVALAPDTLRIAARSTGALTATLTDDRGHVVTGPAITWTSDDTAIATVSDSGAVTGVAEGTIWIRAASGTSVDSVVVVVGPVPVASIHVVPDSSVAYLGATRTLSAVTLAAEGDTLAGRTITWSSLDAIRATVDTAGVVSGVALGTARIVAAAEGRVDTAVVTVRSPISRIVLAPDTLTLTAVGATQTYLATAYDTADVAMSGVTFTWSSANPLVATVSPGSGVSTTATAEGAGLTQIFAQALGAAGAASLRVGQYAATIDASPDTIYVTVGGRATLGAVARDGNGAVMSEAQFVWRKDNAQITLDTLTGALTGASLGASRVWATADGVSSDSVVVIVTNSAAPKLTFSTSSYTVGRFGSVSIPVYLSTSPTSPVTVLLSVSDTTRGRFSSTKLIFNPGQTEQNASVNGLSVGSFTIIAADSAGTFGADTANVQVSIKAELQIPQIRYSYYEWNSYYPTIIQGDRIGVDLRLSDPAPAGGLYFTVSGGATSEAEQQTVFVPAGQLATTFFINARTPGADPVTAFAVGTTSASHLMRVVPANFMIWSNPGGYGRVPYTIGLGQVNHPTDGTSLGIRTPLTVIAPLSADVLLGTAGIIGEAPASVVIATGTARTGYGFKATALGRTTIAASASGWTSDVDTIVVTRPKVKLSNSSYGDSTYVGVGRGRMYATLVDSADVAHYAGDTVRFSFWSGDTSVVTVESDSGVILPGQAIPPGQYLYMQAVGGGSTWIYSGADGYITDSIAVNVRVPKISAAGPLLAAPGYLTPGSITISAARPQGALWFQLQSSDSLVAAFDSVQATYYGSTDQSMTSATARSYMEGTATVIVSAPGYEADTVQVVSAKGRVFITSNSNSGDRYDLQMFQEGARMSAHGLDASSYQMLTAHDTTYFTYQVLDTSIVRMDSTIARRLPGEQLSSMSLPLVPVDVGETQIIVTAPNLAPDTMRVVVTGVQLTISAYRNQLGFNQTNGDQAIGVNIPTVRGTPVVVRLSSRHPEIATLSSDSIVIPAGRTSASFGWSSGSTLGKDTIFVSATGYAPDTLAIEVRTPKILPGGFAGIESQVRTTQTGISGRPYLGVDNDGNPVGNTTIPVTLYVASSDSSVMVPDSAKLHFMPGQTVPPTLPLRFVNPGQAYLIYTDSAGVYLPDSTNKVTVLAPQLGFRMGGYYPVDRLNIGMTQQTDTSSSGSISALTIIIDDPVAGSPLVIDLLSSDTTVVKVPATVTIPVGAKIVTVPIYAQDTTGSIAVYATADGYLQARVNVDVTQPKLSISTTAVMTVPSDTTYRNGLTVYAQSANGGTYPVSEDLVLTLTSSDPSVVSLDHSTVTIPAGSGVVTLATVRYRKPGTATITVTDPRTGFTTYLPASQMVTINP